MRHLCRVLSRRHYRNRDGKVHLFGSNGKVSGVFQLSAGVSEQRKRVKDYLHAADDAEDDVSESCKKAQRTDIRIGRKGGSLNFDYSRKNLEHIRRRIWLRGCRQGGLIFFDKAKVQLQVSKQFQYNCCWLS
jgi:hypothetical protein